MSGERPRVVIIGGGSAQWAPTLITDLLTTPSLRDCELVLEDVDVANLARCEEYARMATEHLGVDATVTATTDEGEALDGADHVVVSISTGGFRAMVHDLAVPERHGIRQSVGDTVGPGGISRSLRNIPVLAAIAANVEQRCPDAWLLNLTNPMTCLTRVAHEQHERTVGLCHEVVHVCTEVAMLAGVPHDAVQAEVAGVNHFPVVTALDVDGRDGLALVRDTTDTGFRERHQVKLWLLEQYGALPGAGDRHLVEFFPHFLTEASGWGKRWGVGLTTIADREHGQSLYVENIDLQLRGERSVPAWQSGELVAPMIDSLRTGSARTMPVNRPNAGQVVGAPHGAIVEAMFTVDGDGIHAGPPVTLPSPFDEWVRRHIAVQELTIAAARRGDRTKVLEAMTLDPLAGRGDLGDVQAMTDELLAATAEWLPQFA
jgi:alpha-galactosidase/6-phospho-beta-glucosidase family protein